MKKRRNGQRRRILKMVGAGGLAGLAAMQGAQATTQITFDGFTESNIDISTLAGFGSNVTASDSNYTVSLEIGGVTGTPDITLTWGVWAIKPTRDGRTAEVSRSSTTISPRISI